MNRCHRVRGITYGTVPYQACTCTYRGMVRVRMYRNTVMQPPRPFSIVDEGTQIYLYRTRCGRQCGRHPADQELDMDVRKFELLVYVSAKTSENMCIHIQFYINADIKNLKWMGIPKFVFCHFVFVKFISTKKKIHVEPS